MSATVIPYQYWKSPSTGRTFTIYSSWHLEDSILITDGFTIAWPDGTSGTGRKPFPTEAEAQAYIDKNPNFRGMGSLGD